MLDVGDRAMTERNSLQELYRQTVTFPGPGMPLAALQTALDAIEEELSHARDQATVRLRARHKREGDELHPDDRELDQYELEVTINQVLPRVFRGGFLLAMWSVLETVAKRMAEYVCGTRGLPTVQREFRHGNFLKSLNRVYTGLGIISFPDQMDYEQLDQLRQIRNALIHYNGSVAGLPDSMRTLPPEGYADLGLTVYGDLHEEFFVPNAEFLTRNLALVRSYLTSLSERAYVSAHPHPLTDDYG